IYNHVALRQALRAAGHRFASSGDGEVIVHLWEQCGARCVDRLRGMFAFALWDARMNALFVARDRLGIKPLYLHRCRTHVLFASELRALLASNLVSRRIDVVALDQFLASQTVASPRTLITGVEMVEPGTQLTFTASRDAVERRYWDLMGSAAPSRDVTESENRSRVNDLLAESTRLHLVSDVPVAVFLSSGVDSTAVAALVRATGAVPHTFCVSFPGTSYDEGPSAHAIARRLGAEHLDIPLTEAECRDQLPQALAAVDHPSADGINTYVVSRAVRSAGLKVALSGLGGDELFGGYPSFRRLRRIAKYARAWRWSPSPVRRMAAATLRTFGRPSVGAAKAAALLETDGRLPEAYPLMRQLFSSTRRAELLGAAVVEAAGRQGDPYVGLLERVVERHPQAGLMSMVSYAEARTYMHDVLLRDTDQMSMRHGLEVRVPLLDHRLVEYVMGLPDCLKQPGDTPKRLLIDAVGGDLLPEIARRPKQGFVLPFDLWMRGDLRDFCEHHLGPRGIAGRSVFNPPAVESVWHSFLAREGETWSRPWALVALHAWMESTGVSV
ncbi:MAG: asparagine synthase (glutamine-hydrolyzing), partial [Vicinamibacterales bacterium]